MSQSFQFKQFSITQEHSALKLGTDAVLLGAATQFNTPKSILDIGTGTGILALMMAQKYDCSISAIDIDENSIIDAQQNVSNCRWANRIDIQNISIQEFAINTTEKFDGIICNPPFFSHSLTNPEKNKATARHTIALTPNDLFRCIDKLLNADGKASIIIPTTEKALFSEAAANNDLYLTHDIQIFPFVNSQSANRHILFYAKSWKEFSSSSIHIRNEDKTYSDEYKKLTTDYYCTIR